MRVPAKVLLFGSGELGKEFVISAKRLGKLSGGFRHSQVQWQLDEIEMVLSVFYGLFESRLWPSSKEIFLDPGPITRKVLHVAKP